jgi:hypothetical protein
MRAAAHTPGGYDGVPQSVGREFVDADKEHPNRKLPERVKKEAGGAAVALAQRLATGGAYQSPYPSNYSDDSAAYGLVASSVPGRTDRHNVDLPAGSYVLPADVVSGLGEGNSMAGAGLIDKMLASGPWGSKITPIRAPNTIPHAPSAYQSAEGNYQMHNMVANSQLADGGSSGGQAKASEPNKKVPAVIAGGEFVIPPKMIAYHPLLGNGDPSNTDPAHYANHLKHGHETLDAWVKLARKDHIKTLEKLPGPVK